MIERLLDHGTIRRMCAGIKIGSRQRTAAEKWLGMLDDGLLENEKKNHLNFFKVVLVDLLDYPEEQIKYEEDYVDFAYAEEGRTISCIETKGTSTKNLFIPQARDKKEHETPVKQTWNYMGSKNAEYGICTNYRDFVLITKKFALTKYHIFDFESIRNNSDALKEFLGVFSAPSLASGFPYKVQGKSADADMDLTSEFYSLYSQTRLMLIREFEDKEMSRGEAVATAQTFLNRLMFVFFAEDAGLVKKGMFDRDMIGILGSNIKANTKRVWNYVVEELFTAFENGQTDPHIAAFDGGLFKDPLHKNAFFPDKRKEDFFDGHCRISASSWEYKPRVAEAVRGVTGLNPIVGNLLKLSSYDFQSQIRVDILGHIFENSVSDLEVLLGRRSAERRQEGIYYTPEYVTRHICHATIIRHLSRSGDARNPAELVVEYRDSLDDLHERMGRIRILDPACGSGAFLIGAARTLIDIHEEIMRYKYLDDESGNGLDQSIDAGRISKIVRNNIHGIDINPQSVDIARLSLFLLTAADGETLPDLSSNVMVGNSVTVDPDHGGLDWTRAFPAVFRGKNPGFSVIIGNPPYVRQESLTASAKRAMAALPSSLLLALHDGFLVPKTSDLSAYFYYHSLGRLCKNGRLGFISGDNWLRTKYGKPLRQALLSNAEIDAVISPRFKVFSDADVNTVIVLLKRRPPSGESHVLFANAKSDLDFAEPSLDTVARVRQGDLGAGDWSLYFDKPEIEPLFPVMRLGDAGTLRRGVTTGCNDFFILSADEARNRGISAAYLWPIVTGGELPRLTAKHATKYLLDVRAGKGALAKTAPGRLVKKYIEAGEAMTVSSQRGGRSAPARIPDLPTVAGRDPWYSLPVPEPPPIFISRINDRALRVYENGRPGRRDYQAVDTYLHFTPAVKKYTSAFLAFFASSLFALRMERHAAPLGAGGLRIDNRVLAEAPVPDFGQLSGGGGGGGRRRRSPTRGRSTARRSTGAPWTGPFLGRWAWGILPTASGATWSA